MAVQVKLKDIIEGLEFPDSRMVKKLELGFTIGFRPPSSPQLRLACCLLHPAYSTSREGGTNGGDRHMDWKTLLAYITGSVDQELLLRNAYLVTENRILRKQIKGCVRLSDGERKTLAEIGQRLGKQALAGSGEDRQARHDSRLAPEARGQEV